MAVRQKPEHMTHLDHETLVRKDHPRIRFRGMIDRIEGEILVCQYHAVQSGHVQLTMDLQEMLEFVRNLIPCDVLGKSVGEINLCGYSADELREHSQYPEKYYGQPHFMASVADDPALLFVNRLRTVVRQAELAGYEAFKNYDGSVKRPDIILAMNRLSSLCWIMMIKVKAGAYNSARADCEGVSRQKK